MKSFSYILLFLAFCFSFEAMAQENNRYQTIDPGDTASFQIGRILECDHIYFHYDKGDIQWSDSITVQSLNGVLAFMKKYPHLIIEIGNHTDSRGSAMYSRNISQLRARSLRDWFIKSGIASERLVAKGYLESRLLISDAEIKKLSTKEEKEKAHQMNRRTEFLIIGKKAIQPK